ncbi:hypothetical protein UYO_2548, partial [Lachnospiraceae bacterium JC7]
MAYRMQASVITNLPVDDVLM